MKMVFRWFGADVDSGIVGVTYLSGLWEAIAKSSGKAPSR
jgi:hypothetical protein